MSILKKILDPDHPDLQRLIEDLSIFLKLTGREMEASALKAEIVKREKDRE